MLDAAEADSPVIAISGGLGVHYGLAEERHCYSKLEDRLPANCTARMDQDDRIRLETRDAEAEVLLAGGCLANYRLLSDDGGIDLLRPCVGRRDGTFSPLESASFPLIPYSNRIRDGRFSFAEQTYQLPLNFGDHPHSIHGVAWQSSWQPIRITAAKAVIELDYRSGDWPFPFRAVQSFELDGAALRQEIAVTNTHDVPAPAGLGVHPYFPRHGGAVLQAEAEFVWLTDETCLPTERVACPPNWDLGHGIDVDNLLCDNQFEPWNGRASIKWPDQGLSLDLEASGDLDRLVVYAPEDEDFFCVEPVSHITDAFNRSAEGMAPEASGMRILAPGETWRVWLRLNPKYI